MSIDLDFKVRQIQFALFPKNLNLLNIDKAKIALDLKTKTRGLFDADPFIISLPPEAPAVIPRITLQSKDNIFKCDIAISRIDFFLRGDENKEFMELKEDFLLKAKQIYSYFIDDLENYHLPISRIGFVVDFIANLGEESANKILQEQLLNKGSYFSERRTENISLVFTEKDKIEKWEINRLIRFDSLRKTIEPFSDDKLILKYDINTPSEKMGDYNLTTENVEQILSKASGEMTENLNKFIKQLKS